MALSNADISTAFRNLFEMDEVAAVFGDDSTFSDWFGRATEEYKKNPTGKFAWFGDLVKATVRAPDKVASAFDGWYQSGAQGSISGMVSNAFGAGADDVIEVVDDITVEGIDEVVPESDLIGKSERKRLEKEKAEAERRRKSGEGSPRSTRGRPRSRVLPLSQVDLYSDLLDMGDLDFSAVDKARRAVPGQTTYLGGPLLEGTATSLLHRPKSAKPPKGVGGAAKLGMAGRVLGGLGLALTAYEILNEIGSSTRATPEFMARQQMGVGDTVSRLLQPSRSTAVGESRSLAEIAAGSSRAPVPISSELQALIAGQEDTLRSLRQNVNPTMTQAYAQMGLI